MPPLDFPNAPANGEVFSRWRWDGEKWVPTASTGTAYLPLTGGAMSGPIVLAGNAAANLNPVPLQQLNARLVGYLPLTGGTLSGPLFVTGNMVATALVQGGTVNATGDLTAGGNIGTNNTIYGGAAQINTFYANPTFTGSVTVNGNISTPNGVYAAVVQAATYAGSVTVTGSMTVNGNIGTVNTVYAGAVQTPQLNGNVYVTGNLNSGGQVQGNSLYARDRVDAVGGIFAGNLFQSTRGDDLAFYAPYGGITIGTAFVSNRGGGQLGVYVPYADIACGGQVSAANMWCGNHIQTGYLDASSDITAANDVRAGGTLISNNGIYLQNDGSFHIWQAGGGREISFATNWYLVWNTGNGDLTWVNPSGVNWHMAATGFCYANITSVGGRGEYVNFSDIRFKDASTITPTTRGLVEILQLNPVEYEYLPPQTEPPPEGSPPVEPKRYLGFIAQEVQPIIPEAVNVIGVPAPDGTGGMETADPTLGVTSASITAALVNAIKEINTQLTDLNTRLAALEGA